ncbi:MAG: hypothetical protein P1U74_07240 [Legionellaceae bacterium]|nr:hypothetical protein [Legionellaceae bacterium]
MSTNKDEYIQSFLGDIQRVFFEYWIIKSDGDIRKKMAELVAEDEDDISEQAILKQELEDEITKQSTDKWNNQYGREFESQLTLFYTQIEESLKRNHPWLSEDQELCNELIYPILANAFTSKDSIAAYIETDNMQLITDALVIDQAQRIQGCPLSDLSLYQKHRSLSSAIDTPYTKSPTRYDIYRLLLNIYGSKEFKTKVLRNKIACTQVAPMHHSELENLSPDEWRNLKTIIVNIGEERSPKWVLLTQEAGNWTCFAPQEWQGDIAFDHLNQLNSMSIDTLNYINDSEYDDSIAWHAVLLSRILPWSLLAQNKPMLESYRADIPVTVLLQNSLEQGLFDKPTSRKDQSTYRSFEQEKSRSNQAFTQRAPFSQYTAEELYAGNHTDIEYLMTSALSETPITQILAAFDAGLITYDSDSKSITVSDKKQLIESMKIAYYQKAENLLLRFAPSQQDIKSLNEWFSYNLELTNIDIYGPPSDNYSSIYALAARNRFFKESHPNYLSHAQSEIQARRQAWDNTGGFIYSFLQNPEIEISSDNFYLFKNIAEMGNKGLELLFKHIEESDLEPLSCTLSLDSGKTISSASYIKNLTRLINSTSKKPLFKKLDIILPDNLDKPAREAFIELISALDKQNDISEINLHNLDVDNNGQELIEELNSFARRGKTFLQIKSSAWDETIPKDRNYHILKSSYKELQNTIEDNIRKRRELNLENQTRKINEPSPVSHPIQRVSEVIDDTSWTKGEKYSLVSQSLGVQQQAQQEVAQEVQQEAEQQPEVKMPAAKRILDYGKDESELIGRYNLAEKGISEKDFSDWVGSNVDGKYIIQKIDAAALAKIQEFSELFKFGIDWERTPGFRVFYAKDKSWILTYNKDLEHDDLEELQKDPFAMRLSKVKTKTDFYGDYRQLEPLAGSSGQDSDLANAWHYLASETLPKSIHDWLEAKGLQQETSEPLQYLDNHTDNSQPFHLDDLNKMRSLLKNWYQTQQDSGFSREFFDGFTEHNMQAFGQLFRHYGIVGCQKWFELVLQLHETFPSNFPIFKQTFLDSIDDWSELLEEDEVSELSNSMQKLRSHQDYQDGLWQLISLHGKTALKNSSKNRVRFAEIWQAYDMVIDYIEANDLNFNKKQFIDALKQYPDGINATEFLRRLRSVLENTGNRQDSMHVQNEILSNLCKIDWRENGFYYACIHENYRFWDESLQFSALNTLNGYQNGYTSSWDSVDLKTITEPLSYTLRYAAQRLKLNKENLNIFKDLISTPAIKNNIKENFNIFKDLISTPAIKNNIQVQRLILASLALGVDNLTTIQQCDWSKLADKKYSTILMAINSHLLLDEKDLSSQSYHIKISDMPLLLEVLLEENRDVRNLDLDALNAIGRAMRCYESSSNPDKKNTLKKLVQHGMQNGFNKPEVTAYPWLVSTPITIADNEQRRLFYNQLATINFATSTKYPSKSELETYLQGMTTEQSRHQAVQDLIEQGCMIADQDASFRPLNEEEKGQFANVYLLKTFKDQNQKLITKLCERIAIKDEGNSKDKVQKLIIFFLEIDRKSYYDELGYLLGLLVEKSDDKYYSIEQLTQLLHAVFDQNQFKTNPYPVSFIKILVNEALENTDSSLLNGNLHKLTTTETYLDRLTEILDEINLAEIPHQAKKTLVSIATKFKDSPNLEVAFASYSQIFHGLKTAPRVSQALNQLIINQLDYTADHEFIERITKLAIPCPFDEEFKKLWESDQIKLLRAIEEKTITDDQVDELINIEDPTTRMIVNAVFKDAKDLPHISAVKSSLQRMNPDQRLMLARYCKTIPIPTMKQVSELLTKYPNDSQRIINHFEANMQKFKRDYNLTKQDKQGLIRILSNFKLKATHKVISASAQVEMLHLLYYMNTYSTALNLQEKSNEDILKYIHKNTGSNDPESKARVLACMREILYRKTGKWANHTQMVALLYGAVHNDDNLLFQIKTGEGKGLFSVMRVAYRALNGQVVDVFSSKESLSARDHEEFAPVLDAFEIPNSHITASSSPDTYKHKVNKKTGVGAVNYATLGGFSLFISGLRWDNKDRLDKIDLSSTNRFAFLDEGDHLMLDEDTLFNYSDSGGASSVYNYDTWVYEVAYDFYLENEQRFNSEQSVDEYDDLRVLYNRLQETQLIKAPKESNYFQKFLASGDTKLRNTTLFSLIMAAKKAHSLKDGVDFSVMEEPKEIFHSEIDRRFAKVRIKNQIYHGSTYSETVQQMLHVRLNKDAVANGITPNFFVEPESEIALSLNSRYVLKKYYLGGIESCTGTPGNLSDLDIYKNEFHFDDILKVPTHHENSTHFLQPIYTSDLNAQVTSILESINSNPNQPVLITCVDDEEVEQLGKLIAERLPEGRNLLVDLSANGVAESEIVKTAGLIGAITISSRVGRGTDITPYDKEQGLRLIRAYAVHPRDTKQEQGRQGRYDAGGVCQEIINYAEIEEKFEKYKENEEFNKLLAFEVEHLNVKLAKHESMSQSKEIWVKIREDDALKLQYLHTRTVTIFEQYIKEQSRKHIHRKDDLIAEGSGQVMNEEMTLKLKESWKKCKKELEAIFLGEFTEDKFSQARKILDEFYEDNQIPPPREPHGKELELNAVDNDESIQESLISERIDFYQTWFNKMKDYNQGGYHNVDDLALMYKSFKYLERDRLEKITEFLDLYPEQCCTISYAAWTEAVTYLTDEEPNTTEYETRLDEFFKKTPATHDNFEKLFLAAVRGAPDVAFLLEEIEFYDIDLSPEIIENLPRKIVNLFKNQMNGADRCFALEAFAKAQNPADIINPLINKYSELISNPSVIRPLIACQLRKMDESLLESIDLRNPYIAKLLDFFSQRPEINKADYERMLAKINDVPADKVDEFLDLIITIPANIPVKAILKQLRDLPGMHTTTNALEARIEIIREAARPFNQFLSRTEIIGSDDYFALPIDQEKYKEWTVLFGKLNMSQAKDFFTKANTIDVNSQIEKLKAVADNFVKNKSTIGMDKDMNSTFFSSTKTKGDNSGDSPRSVGMFR